jgi:hypothetical protein
MREVRVPLTVVTSIAVLLFVAWLWLFPWSPGVAPPQPFLALFLALRKRQAYPASSRDTLSLILNKTRQNGEAPNRQKMEARKIAVENGGMLFQHSALRAQFNMLSRGI